MQSVKSALHKRSTLCSFSPNTDGSAFEATGRSALEEAASLSSITASSISANLTITRQDALFCTRLLILHESIGPGIAVTGNLILGNRL